jgi:hypothetical protein
MPLIQLRMQNLQTGPIIDGAVRINETFSTSAFAEIKNADAPLVSASLPHCIGGQGTKKSITRNTGKGNC